MSYSDSLRQAWDKRQSAIHEHRSILDGIGEEPTADQSAALQKVEAGEYVCFAADADRCERQ